MREKIWEWRRRGGVRNTIIAISLLLLSAWLSRGRARFISDAILYFLASPFIITGILIALSFAVAIFLFPLLKLSGFKLVGKSIKAGILITYYYFVFLSIVGGFFVFLASSVWNWGRRHVPVSPPKKPKEEIEGGGVLR